MEHTHTTVPNPSPKNVVILCGGTGNEISETISNVLKFHPRLRKTDSPQPRQMMLSHPGSSR